jgi:hypothetical protein
MPAKVNKINLAGFRGATAPVKINFDTTKPVTLIFGENGTGKSTIADAFDFVCNAGFGSLEDRSFSGQSKTHVAAIGQGPQNLQVALSTSKGDFTAALGKAGPTVSPASGCPDARILRRSNILQMLNAQPKQRFEALKSFITVPGIENSENALRAACDGVKKSLEASTLAYTQAESELKKLWTAEGTPGESAFIWAKSEANKDIEALRSSVEAIDAITEIFRSSEDALESLDDALEKLTQAGVEQAKSEKEQKEIEARQPKVDAALLKLLQDARSFVAARKPDQCPVCEQKITSAALVGRMDARISGMSQLSLAVNAVSKKKQGVEGAEAVVTQMRKKCLKQIRGLAGSLKSCGLEEVTNMKISWHEFGGLTDSTEDSAKIEQEARGFWKIASQCRQTLSARKLADQKSINQRNAIKGHIETHEEKLKTAKELISLSDKLKKALEIVSQERKGYVEGVLGAISGEVERLYTTLHPGEGIGKVRFYLKPKAIGSLELDAQFQNVADIPPQAYYSESHLDTLGICVFLALAKHFKKEDTIVVLDDVVTSVDGQHLDRFMKLLHDEALQFNQVIVTTHYRPWRDRYRWAKGPTANTQVIELGPWTLQNGLQAGHFVTAVTELKDDLSKASLDRQAMASKAGIVLESLLDFITLKYRCSVPRNVRNEYTLGDLTHSIDSKLAKVLLCRKPGVAGSEKSNIYLKPIIDAATSAEWIRNCVGCHLHALGSEVPDIDVRNFAQSVLVLAETLICQSCGTLATRRPSGSFWQCSCGELELHPLVCPGADPRTVDDET